MNGFAVRSSFSRFLSTVFFILHSSSNHHVADHFIKDLSRWSGSSSNRNFVVGSYGWQVAIYPTNSGDKVNNLGIYLVVAHPDKLPPEAHHKFDAENGKWSYPSFMPLIDLHDQGKWFLVNDTLFINTSISYAQEDTISSIFTWTIEKFSTLKTEIYSMTFLAGSYEWRIRIYPRGNGDNIDKLEMYLYVVDSDDQPHGWNRFAQYDISVVDQVCGQYTVRKELQHKFDAQSCNWGFPSFMLLKDLHDPIKGFLVNNSLIVKVGISAGKIVEYHSYDSKKETGYVGLKNHGSISYINSRLQTLYHIPSFRKVLYHIPAAEKDMQSRSISVALQRLFYELQYSNFGVATNDLFKSLEWDINGSITCDDIQELSMDLYEKLEDNAKATIEEGSIQELFMGHLINYIECVNVDYSAKRPELFYELQLDVKGCRDVYASFDKYVGVEHLEGDKKYHTTQHGLQNAKKAVLFTDFPPVLQLKLKRFDYDFRHDTMVKIYDQYDFPLELDLDQGNGKYLSPDADPRTRNLFTLHGVLVHKGGEHDGRYHVFIRPTLYGQWFQFDEEKVIKEGTSSALGENYGSQMERTLMGFTKNTNAHMLVYIRKSDMERIMCHVDEQDIVENVRLRLKKEQEEKEHKKKEGRYYTVIKVAQHNDLIKQIGRDFYFDLVDHDKVRCFHINNWMRFCTFKEEIAKEFRIPVRFQRFWLLAKRQNNTYRPSRPLTPEEEIQSVGKLRELSNEAYDTELKLLLDVELGPDLHPILLPKKTNDNILLFFKLYSPKYSCLRYVGRLYVQSTGCPSGILTKLNKMAYFCPNQDIDLYKETMYEPCVVCEHIDKNLTFQANQLEDGDIVCFQKSLLVGTNLGLPDIPSFMKYQGTYQVVNFRPLQTPKIDVFKLRVWKFSVYDEIVERVAHQLNVSAANIRLTPHNSYCQQPKASPIEYRGVNNLSDMLVDCNQTAGILYYEILDTAQAGPHNRSFQPTAPSSCVICYEAPSDGACAPCGHMAGCMSCLNKIKDENMGCPVCRAEIQYVLKLYSA